jgi:hypothetical protein
MDYIQAMNWLTLIAFICGFSAAALVAFEVGGWVIDWIDNYRERRASRNRNHAHPWKKGW